MSRDTGCDRCHGTGYSGRRAVYELLEINAALAESLARKNPAEFVAAARAAMAGHTLRDQAIALARAGVTTLAEAMRASAQDETELMPRFAYTGRTRGGDKTQGVLEADNAAACAGSLLKNGISPVTIQETGQAERRGAKPKGPGLFEPGVQAIDVLLFSRQLYTLLRSGVPILRALTGLRNRRPMPRLPG